jgi:hypothetical protein
VSGAEWKGLENLQERGKLFRRRVEECPQIDSALLAKKGAEIK